MNRTEFLEAIYTECSFLPGQRRRQVMSYFSSLFTGYDSDLDIIEKLGTPQEALRSYLNTSKVTSKIPKPLFIAAILLLSPFITDIAIFALVLAAVILIFAIIILIVAPLAGITLWFNGVGIIFQSVPQAVILADKLWQIGIGLMYFAGGIAILLLVYKLYSKLVPWILGRFSALYHKIEKRRTK